MLGAAGHGKMVNFNKSTKHMAGSSKTTVISAETEKTTTANELLIIPLESSFNPYQMVTIYQFILNSIYLVI